MQHEAHYIANELDVLSQQILAQCEEFPEFILHWPPPIPGGHSLFTLALEAITLVEEWILIPVSGVQFSALPCSKKSSIETLSHLRVAYKQWSQEVHKLLDLLPSSLLDCSVEIHPAISQRKDANQGETICIRSCLFHALVEVSMITGKMQILRQLFIDGERMLTELPENIYMD